MKKKIFFIMSTDDYSGAEAVNFKIIEGLKDKYDFYWVSKKGNINDFLSEKKVKWIEIEKLTVSEIRRIIRENKPDILHATDYKSSVICSLSKGNCYLIEHLHNNAPWLKKICINSVAFLLAASRADKILTVSHSIEEEYIFSKLLKKKFFCIGNPISRVNVLKNVSDDNFKKKYDICCCARLTASKNPYKFLKIIYNLKKKFKDIKVIWIGKGELEEYFKQLISENNLEGNIDYVGFKKNPYKYMASSKLFLLTSDWEGFGLVAFESLTLGLPCIVTNVGGLPSIVDDSCGIVTNDINEMIIFISKILTNENMYDIYSKNAIVKSKKIENITSYIKNISDIYSR